MSLCHPVHDIPTVVFTIRLIFGAASRIDKIIGLFLQNIVFYGALLQKRLTIFSWLMDITYMIYTQLYSPSDLYMGWLRIVGSIK